MDRIVNSDLISVVIPLFNAEKFLQPLMDSIVQQTYTNWEVIFVDDGSQDNSVRIVRNQIAIDNRFRLLIRPEHEVKGAPTCRNIGMKKAKGEFIIFFDADDIIADYCFQHRLEAIKHYKTDFCVFPLVGFKEILNDLDQPPILGFKTNRDPIHYLLQKRLPFVVVTNIYKLEVLKSKEILWDVNVKSLQDSDFNICCLVNNLSYQVVLTKPDYFWRMGGNENSISKLINGNKHFKSHLYVFEKQSGYFNDSKEYDADFDSFVYFLLMKFICGQDYKTVTDFLKSTYFRGKWFYILRLKIFSSIMIYFRVHSHFILRLFYFVLLPKQSLQIKRDARQYYDDYNSAYSKIV